jgi:hypothetical protein
MKAIDHSLMDTQLFGRMCVCVCGLCAIKFNITILSKIFRFNFYFSIHHILQVILSIFPLFYRHASSDIHQGHIVEKKDGHWIERSQKTVRNLPCLA